jgi:hypothetical protein
MNLEAGCDPSPAGTLSPIEEVFSDFILTFRASDFSHLFILFVLNPIHLLNKYRAALLAYFLGKYFMRFMRTYLK